MKSERKFIDEVFGPNSTFVNFHGIINLKRKALRRKSINFLQNQLQPFNLAEWLKTCLLKSPNFTQCSTTSVQGLFSHLIQGIQGIQELDTIDPMKIDRIRILQGDGPVSVNASLSKVTVTGFSKLKLIENQVSSKDFSWLTTVTLPKLRLEGNYHMQGRILVIPLNVSIRFF